MLYHFDDYFDENTKYFLTEDDYLDDEERESLILWSRTIEKTFPPHINPLLEDVPEVTPKYLADSEGNFLLYPGEIHLIYGKPGTLKSWITLSLMGNCNVKYFDFENMLPTLKHRLTMLNTSVSHATAFTFPELRDQVLERIRQYTLFPPDVVCFDGFPGLASLFGVNPDSNVEIAALFNQVLDPLKRAGIAVVLLDHLPKDGTKEDYPIGAQTKKSQCGVAYLLKQRGDSSKVDLFVTKDRHYVVRSRCSDDSSIAEYGWVELVNTGNRFMIKIQPDLVAEIDGRIYESIDVNLRLAICAFLLSNPGASQTDIEKSVIGKGIRIRDAISDLIDNAYLEIRALGSKKEHYLVKPFKPTWRPRDSRNGVCF